MHTPSEKSPHERGFSQITVPDTLKARLKGRKGDRSIPGYLAYLVGKDEAQETPQPPGIPVEALEPITVALHDLERGVQANRFGSTAEVLQAIRSIRRLVDQLGNQ